MPALKGKLWQDVLRDGTPVWLLEWELGQRLERRVLLAVDTSSSCVRERDWLKTFFRVLADALELGDSCALWIMGRRERVLDYRIGHSQDRSELAQRLTNALIPVRHGSWLRETLGAMLVEANHTDLTNALHFFLVVSDGEIFDAEALSLPSPLGFVRLGGRESSQLEVIKQQAVALAASESALKIFFVNPPITAMLDHGWCGARLVEFSDQGEIVGELPRDTSLSIKNGQTRVRLAYVGGIRPRPRLRYQAGEQTWEATEVEDIKLLPDHPAHLRKLLRALEGNEVDWDWERLQLLAGDQAKQERLSCPNPKCHRIESLARRSLFCGCQALLVSQDVIKKDDVQELYGGAICFPIIDGKVCGKPVSCKRNAGNHAYEMQEDDGQSWLVLNLYK